MIRRHNPQSGAISLFVVVFAALLITVITVSFVRLMIRDQQEASTNDLSQSAYDSALAGVEDAKRALIRYRTICENSSASACADARALVTDTDCNQGLQGIVTVTPGQEIIVQQSGGDAALNQAYTCVKIQLETEDYLGNVPAFDSRIIPLEGTGDFDTVTIEWYTADDLEAVQADDFTVDLLPATSLTQPLFRQSDWTTARPSLMRVQLMQMGSSFRLSDFDDSDGDESNANTLFLYPVGTTGAPAGITDTYAFIDRDARKTPIGAPLPVTCSGVLSSGGYACKVELELPDPIGGGSRTAYLRLTSLYNASHFRVTLNGTKFDSVQPSVDATGRANDLFRRVESRIELVDEFPFPLGAVNVTGNFCKDFSITDRSVDYVNSCTP